jgi:DNA phosphorothioation-associated putative methyltransferase
MTTKGTFQKFFPQEEIRTLIEQVTGSLPVAAAPGLFYTFKDELRAQDFRARLVRSHGVLPRITVSEEKFERHRDLLSPLIGFVEQRGRLPLDSELPDPDSLKSVFGSMKAAFALVRRVEGDERWDAARKSAQDNLLVILALAAFRGRPKMSALSDGLQADVKALFGSYTVACDEADRTLFGLGEREQLDRHLRSSPVGKILPDALYVHKAALSWLNLTLRLYEGCGRTLVGEVAGANVIKLSREHRRVSYLSYRTFDRDPHPALSESVRVDLQTFAIKHRDFAGSDNPPILHRKETLVPDDYPRREKFLRLTEQEERRGLLDSGRYIGTRRQWEDLLAERGVRLSGHRLVADKALRQA